jgi:hypothetical protein
MGERCQGEFKFLRLMVLLRSGLFFLNEPSAESQDHP